jgi:hypothetical protein
MATSSAIGSKFITNSVSSGDFVIRAVKVEAGINFCFKECFERFECKFRSRHAGSLKVDWALRD